MAALGEYVGDYAGLSVAHDAFLDRPYCAGVL